MTDTIDEKSLETLPTLTKDGFSFRVDFIKGGDVFYAKWRGDKPKYPALCRMPIADFIKAYNAGVAR